MEAQAESQVVANTLIILTKCQHTYLHQGVTNIRLSKNELRWTNANGEKRSMALVFIEDWK